MLVKIKAIFSIVVGAALCGIWTALLVSGSVADLQERPALIITHLISEFLTAGFLIAGGIFILRKKRFALRVFLLAQGLLMYSSLNAGAYYADNGGLQATFLAVFAVSFLLALLTILRRTPQRK